VTLLDGTRDLAALTREISAKLSSGTLPSPPELDPHRLTGDRLAQQVRGACERLLSLFARHGVLVAAGDHVKTAADDVIPRP
jgi:hypothetical protein